MDLIKEFVHNPVKISVGVLLLALFGAVAFFRMPMQLTPEVQTPTLTIETRWPGATPLDVEKEIVQEQEEQLKSVEGVIKMTSESMDSNGKITLEFAVGEDMNEALLKVNSRLQQVREYPIEADEPVISTSNASDRPIAWFILSARSATTEQLREAQREHPELADELEHVLSAAGPGLAIVRLKRLAAEHPELKPLLPPDDLDVMKMRRFCEDFIEARFERVDGVSNANVIGGLEDELQVVVDPERLAARQLTLDDVRQALAGQNKDTSAGDFWEGKRRYVVRTQGRFRSPEQVEEQILSERDGQRVYVRDVATVRLGYKKPDGVVRRYGTACIAINAMRETGANVLDVMDGLKQATGELNERLLYRRGLELTQVYDETEYIHSAVGLVNENIILGGALTMIVLMFFLSLEARTLIFTPLVAGSALAALFISPWFFVVTLALILAAGFWFARGALVVSLAIPISIIGTFLVLNMLGRSLNVISLAGLAFAVGMLVDNAVVVLENIYSHYQNGRSPFNAAISGAQEVWGAVVASTLTTLAVFVPVIFVEQEAGQLFRDIALAISAAVALSMLVSITVIPPAAARLLKNRIDDAPLAVERNGSGTPRNEPRGENLAARLHELVVWPIQAFAEMFVDAMVRINAWVQGGLLRRLVLVGGVTAACVVLSWAMMPKVEYLPTGNRNLVFGIVLPPPGYSLDKLMALGQTVEDELKPHWDVDPGSPEAAKLDFPPIADFFFVARGRQVFLGLRSADPMRARDLQTLIGGGLNPRTFQPYPGLRDKLPGTFLVAKQASLFETGIAAGRTIDIEITGPELDNLLAIGGRVMGQLNAYVPPGSPEGTQPTQLIPLAQTIPKPSLDQGGFELSIEPHLAQSADMKMNSDQIGYTVNALIDGAYATDYYEGNDKIDLTIIGERAARERGDLATPGLRARPAVEFVQEVEGLPIATPSGQLVPLASLALVSMRPGPEQVNHRERQRAITIEVSPPPHVALEDAINTIRASIVEPLQADGTLEGGYMVTLSGTADKLSETWNALYWNLLLALLITYLLMAALFESWIYPLVIIFSVPLGAVGGIFGLRLLSAYLLVQGQPPQALDVLTMLGFVILIGTVVNNPILIVHQSLNYMREQGLASTPAILESVRTRIRPIFMTTFTTVLGLAPLVLFPGAGSELYRGLGAVLLGGLLISTLLTLVFVPAMFSLTLDLVSLLRRLLGQPPADESLPKHSLTLEPVRGNGAAEEPAYRATLPK